MRKLTATVLLILFGFVPSALAQGGSISVSTSKTSVAVGASFTASLRTSSGGTEINAIGADLHYPADLLQVVSIGGSSVITLFVTKGVTGEGLVSIQGGIQPAAKIVNGAVGTVTFKALKEGAATISISGSSGLYANDGAGTNVLAGLGSATITIGPGTPTPPAGPPTPPTPPGPAAPPQPPTPSKVPPTVTSDSHPDPTAYYNSNDVSVSWSAPGATSYVYVFDQSPDTVPSTGQPTTAHAQLFKGVADGTWYLHVRALVDKAWGPTAHRKCNIDTVAPELGLDVAPGVEIIEGTPVRVTYWATDAGSGVDHYELANTRSGEAPIFGQVDSAGSTTVNDLAAGEHVLTVRATDKAGNVAEKSVNIQVRPSVVSAESWYDVWWIDLVVGGVVGIGFIVAVIWLLTHRKPKKKHLFKKK